MKMGVKARLNVLRLIDVNPLCAVVDPVYARYKRGVRRDPCFAKLVTRIRMEWHNCSFRLSCFQMFLRQTRLITSPRPDELHVGNSSLRHYSLISLVSRVQFTVCSSVSIRVAPETVLS